jgi:hypothetical protein
MPLGQPVKKYHWDVEKGEWGGGLTPASMHEVTPDNVNLIALTILVGAIITLIGLVWLTSRFLFW